MLIKGKHFYIEHNNVLVTYLNYIYNSALQCHKKINWVSTVDRTRISY